jgi:hypothetical protein
MTVRDRLAHSAEMTSANRPRRALNVTGHNNLNLYYIYAVPTVFLRLFPQMVFGARNPFVFSDIGYESRARKGTITHVYCSAYVLSYLSLTQLDCGIQYVRPCFDACLLERST